jgi:hypothetical protein
VAFYRYYNTVERGSTKPDVVRQTVESLSDPEWAWTALEVCVDGAWTDATEWFSGIWLNGDGSATRIATPPGQPDSDTSPSQSNPDPTSSPVVPTSPSPAPTKEAPPMP